MGVNYPCFKGTIELMPREKAAQCGIESLSDVELFALLLDTGTKQENVLELSSRLLFEKGGMVSVFYSEEDLESVKGIGKAKKYRLMAVKEIIRRLPFEKEERAKSAHDVYQMCRNGFRGTEGEKLLVLYLSSDKRILKKEEFSQDSSTVVALPIMTILHHALSSKTKGVIIIHNHPSEKLAPSEMDRYATAKLKEKLKLADVVLLDSMIVSSDGYFSFREEKESIFC